jgi:hypothetical protein
MTRYTDKINELELELRMKEKNIQEREESFKRYLDLYEKHKDNAIALEYILLIAEDRTKNVRDFVQTLINKALDSVFGAGRYRFEMILDMAGQSITLVLNERVEDGWISLDLKDQTGDGMGQIICALYSIIVTEITNHRKLFIFDEIFGGLHVEAVEFIKAVIRKFAGEGAQFAMIEYTFDEFGTQIDVERDEVSQVTSVVGVTKYE